MGECWRCEQCRTKQWDTTGENTVRIAAGTEEEVELRDGLGHGRGRSAYVGAEGAFDILKLYEACAHRV